MPSYQEVKEKKFIESGVDATPSYFTNNGNHKVDLVATIATLAIIIQLLKSVNEIIDKPVPENTNTSQKDRLVGGNKLIGAIDVKPIQASTPRDFNILKNYLNIAIEGLTQDLQILFDEAKKIHKSKNLKKNESGYMSTDYRKKTARPGVSKNCWDLVKSGPVSYVLVKICNIGFYNKLDQYFKDQVKLGKHYPEKELESFYGIQEDKNSLIQNIAQWGIDRIERKKEIKRGTLKISTDDDSKKENQTTRATLPEELILSLSASFKSSITNIKDFMEAKSNKMSIEDLASKACADMDKNHPKITDILIEFIKSCNIYDQENDSKKFVLQLLRYSNDSFQKGKVEKFIEKIISQYKVYNEIFNRLQETSTRGIRLFEDRKNYQPDTTKTLYEQNLNYLNNVMCPLQFPLITLYSPNLKENAQELTKGIDSIIDYSHQLENKHLIKSSYAINQTVSKKDELSIYDAENKYEDATDDSSFYRVVNEEPKKQADDYKNLAVNNLITNDSKKMAKKQETKQVTFASDMPKNNNSN